MQLCNRGYWIVSITPISIWIHSLRTLCRPRRICVRQCTGFWMGRSGRPSSSRCVWKRQRTISSSFSEKSDRQEGRMAHPVVMSKSKTGAVLDTDVLKDVRTEELYRELLRRIGEDPGRDG